MKLFSDNCGSGGFGARSCDEMGLSSFEMLEPRVLLSATLVDGLDDLNVAEDAADTVIQLWDHFDDDAQRQIVEFDTVLGSVLVELYEDTTPQTVANFMNYVDDGDWDGSFIHRSIPGFMVQGGGFTWDDGPVNVPADAAVVNEPVHSNIRGRIAMAKLGGDPDSATTQWFFNLADNSENLDNQNGGFTAFGEVLGDGMDVVDAIAALDRVNAGGAFSDLPVNGWDGAEQIGGEHLVMVNSVDRVQDLQYSVVSNSRSDVVGVSFVDGEMVLDFKDNKYGTAVIEIQAESLDGQTSVTDTFTVTVNSENDAPMVPIAISGISITPGGSDAIDLDTYFWDVESDLLLTYSIIENDNENVITAAINGSELELQASADESGVAVLTIRAEDPEGAFVDTQVTVTGGVLIVLSAAEHTSVTFVDGDGTPVTVSYSGPGVATVVLAGSIPDGGVTSSGKKVTAVGADIVIHGISIEGSTDRSSLTIKTSRGGDGVTTVKDIEVDGTIKAISAKTTDLLGDISVTGSLLSLTLNDVDAAHVIEVGSRGNVKDAFTFVAGNVVDTTLISAIPIKGITVKQWVDVDGLDNDLIDAPSLAKLTTKGDKRANPAIAGDFEAALLLEDIAAKAALGSVKITGTATGLWQVIGSTGSIAAGAFDSDWVGFFGSDYENFYGATELDIYDGGWAGAVYDVKSIKATGDLNGKIFAVEVGSVSAGGDSSTTIGILGVQGEIVIKSIKIKGNVVDSYWKAQGNFGSISAASFDGLEAYLVEVKSIKSGGDANWEIYSFGISSTSVKGGMSGEFWSYGDVSSLSVGGDMTGVLIIGQAGTPAVVKSIKVKGSVLTDDFRVVGDVGSVSVGVDLIGDMTIGRAGEPGSIKKLDIKGSATGGGLWLIGDVGSVSIGVNLTSDMQVGSPQDVGSLKSLKVKGIASDCYMEVYGETGTVAAGSFVNWEGTFDNVKSIASKADFSGWLWSTGQIGSLNVKGNFVGSNGLEYDAVDFTYLGGFMATEASILANYVKSISVGGDMSGRVALVGVDGEAAGKVSVKGTVSESSWEFGEIASRMDVGAISVGVIDDTGIFGKDIKSLKASGNYAGSVNANSLGSVSVRGGWTGGLTLAGVGEIRSTLKSAKISGDMQAGVWTLTGAVGAISANSFDGWVLAGDADVKSIKAKGDFTGELTANSVGSLGVGGDYEGDIDLAGEGDLRSTLKSAKIKGDLTNSTWDIDGDTGSIAANTFNNWTGNLGNVKGITAKGDMVDSEINGDMLKSLSVKGNMTSTDIGLDQVVVDRVTALGSAKITGAVTGGEWEIAGHVGAVSALSFGATVGDEDWTADIIGDVKSISTKGNFTGSVEANSIASVSVKGNLIDATIEVLNASADPRVMALGKMSITGAIDNTVIESAGNVGTVSAKSMVNGSVLMAGVSDGAAAFPGVADIGEFDQNCTIKSLTLKGARDEIAFGDSVIAAWTISKVSIKEVETVNADQQFGITADTIGSLTLYVEGEKMSLKNAEVQADVDQAEADAAVDLLDAEIRLV